MLFLLDVDTPRVYFFLSLLSSSAVSAAAACVLLLLLLFLLLFLLLLVLLLLLLLLSGQHLHYGMGASSPFSSVRFYSSADATTSFLAPLDKLEAYPTYYDTHQLR